MKYLYTCAFLVLSDIGQAQDSIKVVGFSPMSDIQTLYSQNDNSIKFEFFPLSEITKLSIDLYDFVENKEIDLPSNISFVLLRKSEKTKIYTSVENSGKDVIIKSTLIGEYMIVYPVKAKSDENINIFPFKLGPHIEEKTVPIVLLVVNINVSNKEEMNTLSRILRCQQLKDIKNEDINYLRRNSNIIKIITYKMVNEK